MSLASRLGKLSFHGDLPGAGEVADLLDLTHCAALLIDIAQRRVVAANLKATQLTAYTHDELVGISLDQLLPAHSQERLLPTSPGRPSTHPVELLKRNRSTLPLLATFTSLPSRRKWCLLELESPVAVRQRERQSAWAPMLWEALRDYHATMQADDPHTALQSILNIARTLTGADALYVYQLDARQLHLQRQASSGEMDDLPETLPAEELAQLKSPYIWQPGRRAVSSLHRMAITTRLACLATHPLGEAHALVGLLVIASEKPLTDEPGAEQLKLLADAIHATLQQKLRARALLEELEAQALRFQITQLVIDAVKDSVLLVTPDLRITQINAAAASVFGYSPEQVNGQPVTKVLIGSDALASYLSMARDGIPTHRLKQKQLLRRTGLPFPAEISILPLMVEGENQGIAILVCDLIEQEILEGRNLELETRAYLGDMVAMFAHDIRNPINNISTRLQMISDGLPEEDSNRSLLVSLTEEFESLTNSMNTIIANAKAVQYKNEPIDLSELIKRQVERLAFKARSEDIQINLQVEPPIPLIEGDSRALERVFSNLIDNAINAMKGVGGVVVVKVHQVQDPQNERFFVEVSVADSGPGIPKENLEKIFLPFFTTSKTGSGLGLAITKRFVEDHKGRIWLQSFPGGTIFFVRFPILDPLAG